MQGLISVRWISQIDTFIFQTPRLGEEISTSNFLIIRSFSRSAVQTRPAGRGLARCQAFTTLRSLFPFYPWQGLGSCGACCHPIMWKCERASSILMRTVCSGPRGAHTEKWVLWSKHRCRQTWVSKREKVARTFHRYYDTVTSRSDFARLSMERWESELTPSAGQSQGSKLFQGRATALAQSLTLQFFTKPDDSIFECVGGTRCGHWLEPECSAQLRSSWLHSLSLWTAATTAQLLLLQIRANQKYIYTYIKPDLRWFLWPFMIRQSVICRNLFYTVWINDQVWVSGSGHYTLHTL